MKAFRGLLLSTAIALLIVACGGEDSSSNPQSPGGVSPAPQPEGAADLPAETVAQINALLEEKAARSPAQRKISSTLLYAKSEKFAVFKNHGTATEKLGQTKPTELRSLLRYDDQGRVLVDVKGDVDAGLAIKIETAGGVVVEAGPGHRSARAWLPLQSLESLASQSLVKAIHPAYEAQTNRANHPYGGDKFNALTYEQRVANTQAALKALTSQKAAYKPGGARVNALTPAVTPPLANAGSVSSEGSRAHTADRARKFYGVDGTGVTVGVLSDSDDFKEESIATGDLPADTVTIPGQDGRPGSGEGTAMMEIVHDVAPGAKIVFASAFNSPESFADNIRALRFTYHADIIVDDIIYYFESPFQDDIIAAAVDDVTADGAMYFSSAGNFGNYDDGTSGTWEGDFKSGGTLTTLPSGYRVADFGRKVISNRVELGGGPLYLHWSDSGSLDNPLSANDYDLFVLSPDLRTVEVASTDIQDGLGIPFEYLGFIIPADFRVVIAAKPAATPRALRLVLASGELGLSTTGAVYGHAAAKKAFAVAAVDAASAGTGEFTGGATTPVEIYSSDGNRTIFYDRYGAPIGSGQPLLAGSAGEARKKPEIAAADGVSTTLPPGSGLNPFFGTSAAAPHAGAIAALVKSALPTLDAAKIYSSLRSGALDIEAAGIDNDSGSGIVSAMNSLQKAGAKAVAYIDLGAVTVTPNSGTGINPGGGGSLNIQVTNNGGATASAVTGTLSTTTPGVTITANKSSYPNIAAGQSVVNNLPFKFTVSASVPCGTVIRFSLSVAFTGRGRSPTVFSVPVQTGEAGATVTTSYAGSPVPIPDDDTAGVDIPLAVTSAGIQELGFTIDGASCSTTAGATTVGVDHSWVGDLHFTLTSPGGTSVVLINKAGGALNGGNNFCQTVLKDGASSSIQDVTSADAPFTGTFAPANPLAKFKGESATGTWKLNVADDAFLDTGTVRNFSLKVTGFSCPAP